MRGCSAPVLRWEDSGLSALDTDRFAPGRGRRRRVSRFSRRTVEAAAPALRGSCIRGLLWALAFEALSLVMLGVVAFGIYRLQR